MVAKTTIFNVQSYSIHDGPGIRTVVFLKGCPLRCKWCANPESQKCDPELYYSFAKCIKCKVCVHTCENHALQFENNRISVDTTKCKLCGSCVNACPTAALKFSGEAMTSDDVVNMVERDRNYIMNSGGGVTFSGGEPFLHPDFILEASRKLKQLGYHIAVETCGAIPYKNIENCLPYIDLFLFDMKAGKAQTHKLLTGMGNQLILENLRKIAHIKPTVVRIPIIPSVNDAKEEIKEMVKEITSINIDIRVNLLPFHQLGKPKYSAIGLSYELPTLETPTKEYMETVLQNFVNAGLKAEIV